jgi:two-component system, OmpR family, response regulator VicR
MTKSRILIIDDDGVSSKFVRAKLEDRGYQIDLATSAYEAFHCLENAFPDLILVDLCLPRGDGYRICRKVREWSEIPIIMISDNNSELDEVRCLDMGADDFIIRPFSIDILSSRVKAVLRRAEKKKYISEYSLISSS